VTDLLTCGIRCVCVRACVCVCTRSTEKAGGVKIDIRRCVVDATERKNPEVPFVEQPRNVSRRGDSDLRLFRPHCIQGEVDRSVLARHIEAQQFLDVWSVQVWLWVELHGRYTGHVLQFAGFTYC
jgi:hypothetical protein